LLMGPARGKAACAGFLTPWPAKDLGLLGRALRESFSIGPWVIAARGP